MVFSPRIAYKDRYLYFGHFFHFIYCWIGFAVYFLLLLCGLAGGILIPICDKNLFELFFFRLYYILTQWQSV